MLKVGKLMLYYQLGLWPQMTMQSSSELDGTTWRAWSQPSPVPLKFTFPLCWEEWLHRDEKLETLSKRKHLAKCWGCKWSSLWLEAVSVPLAWAAHEKEKVHIRQRGGGSHYHPRCWGGGGRCGHGPWKERGWSIRGEDYHLLRERDFKPALSSTAFQISLKEGRTEF